MKARPPWEGRWRQRLSATLHLGSRCRPRRQPRPRASQHCDRGKMLVHLVGNLAPYLVVVRAIVACGGRQLNRGGPTSLAVEAPRRCAICRAGRRAFQRPSRNAVRSRPTAQRRAGVRRACFDLRSRRGRGGDRCSTSNPPAFRLAQAAELCMNSEGYLSAAAQPVLLQAYGGLAVVWPKPSRRSTCRKSCASRSLHCKKCPHSYEPPCRARWCRRSNACGRNAPRVQPPAQTVRGRGSSSYWRHGCCWRAWGCAVHRAARNCWDGRLLSNAANGSPCCNPHAGCATRRATPRPSIPTKCASASDTKRAKVQRGEVSRERQVLTATMRSPGPH